MHTSAYLQLYPYISIHIGCLGVVQLVGCAWFDCLYHWWPALSLRV